MLQLVVVLQSGVPLSFFKSLFLLMSIVVSTMAISMTLYQYFQPKSEIEDKLSVLLRLLYHFVETWFRLITFVAMFVAVQSYGFILLGISLAFRMLVVCGGAKSILLQYHAPLY